MHVDALRAMNEAIDDPDRTQRRVDFLRKNVERMDQRGEICATGYEIAHWAIDALEALVEFARERAG